MARVSGFLVCENIEPIIPSEQNQNIKTRLIGPLSGALLKYIPTLYSMSVVVCLDDLTEPGNNFFGIKFKLEDEIVFDTDLINIDQVTQGDRPANGMVITLDMNNLEIKSPGDYVFEAYDNIGVIDSFIFTVRKEEN